MKSPLLNRTGFLGALMTTALLLVATGCTDKVETPTSTPSTGPTPVEETIDWATVERKTNEQKAWQDRARLSEAEHQQMGQRLLASTLTPPQLHKLVREGTITDADFFSISQWATLNGWEPEATQLRDRSLVEGQGEFFRGTWVYTHNPLDIMQFVFVYSFGPEGTYEYVVGARNSTKENDFQEWMRHQGTYQINKLSEREDALLNRAGNTDYPYLYTLTFTPDNNSIKFKNEAKKTEHAKTLADYGVLSNQTALFGYRPAHPSAAAALVMQALHVTFGNYTLRSYDFNSLPLSDLPQVK